MLPKRFVVPPFSTNKWFMVFMVYVYGMYWMNLIVSLSYKIMTEFGTLNSHFVDEKQYL